MIKTRSGGYLDFLEPNPEVIQIEDIAYALAHEGRWANHTKRFYSVAEHCVQLSYLSENPRQALMHDATEAYMRDIPAPLKDLLPKYRWLETKLQRVIFQKYGMDHIPMEVHELDKELADTEWLNIVISENWTTLSPKEAEQTFLKRFEELWSTLS